LHRRPQRLRQIDLIQSDHRSAHTGQRNHNICREGSEAAATARTVSPGACDEVPIKPCLQHPLGAGRRSARWLEAC
jgi:hypothetical protein